MHTAFNPILFSCESMLKRAAQGQPPASQPAAPPPPQQQQAPQTPQPMAAPIQAPPTPLALQQAPAQPQTQPGAHGAPQPVAPSIIPPPPPVPQVAPAPARAAPAPRGPNPYAGQGYNPYASRSNPVFTRMPAMPPPRPLMSSGFIPREFAGPETAGEIGMPRDAIQKSTDITMHNIAMAKLQRGEPLGNYARYL